MTQIKYPLIRVRASAKQVEEFYKRGGPRYLRNLLDAPKQDQPTNDKTTPIETPKEQNESK
jgi:hypothetical protein